MLQFCPSKIHSMQNCSQKNFLSVLIGFPPKEINMKNENASLSSVGIKSGDTLIIEKDHHSHASNNEIVPKLTRK